MDDAVLSLEEALKNKTFLVKSYQRGYRWTDTHVDALLQDIADFAKSGKEHESYFLQPVIVKSLKQKDGSESWSSSTVSRGSPPFFSWTPSFAAP